MRFLKPILAISLSSYLFIGSIIPGNSFFELNKLPALMEHFQYHRVVETPGINFFEFIVLHYSDASHEKSDPVHHKKLPVQHGAASHAVDQIVFYGEYDRYCSYSSEPTSVIVNKLALLIESPDANGVFHPPKFS